MAQRRTSVDGIGEVILAKRRGSSSMRLSVNSNGQVRVNMPYWAPYEAGLLFVKSKKSWILEHRIGQVPPRLDSGMRIGKSHRLKISRAAPKNGVVDIRISSTTINATTDLHISTPAVQRRLAAACERALKKQAIQLLPARLDLLSQRFGMPYNSLKIRKLTSRWGSCSTKKNISLSYFLVQLPWELIDYVLVHELAHTKFHNHSPEYWDYMASLMPKVKELRRQLKTYKPRVEPSLI